jgi:hypothetical protein
MSGGEFVVGTRRISERRINAAVALRNLWPALLILALAVLQQSLGSLAGDVSYLITAGDEMLDGRTAYVDFIEPNPPATLLIYASAALAARLSGVSAEFATALFCFISIGASLALCARILRRAGLWEQTGPFGVTGALAVLALLPAHVFAQREHFAVIAGLAFFACLAARAGGRRVDAASCALAGFGAAIMASIKPHFALMILAVLPYFVWRVGWRTAIASLEFYVAAVVCALYAAVTIIFFPAYLEKVAPLALALYAPVREPWYAIAMGTAFKSWFVLGAFLVVLARRRIADPLVAIMALASCGAMLAYFVQGKGWPYHSYPALAFMAMALVMAMAGEKDLLRRLPLGVTYVALILAIAFIAPQTKFILPEAVAPLGAALVTASAFALVFARWREGATQVSILALACVVAIVWMWLDRQTDPFNFEAQAAALTSHPKVLAISGDTGVGFPFVRRIGGRWAQRDIALWVTAGARWRIAQSGSDPAVVAMMEPYLQLDRDMLVDDILQNRPDLILISNRFGEFHDWAFADPMVRAALADYRLYASDGDSRGETFLYARADLIPPHPTLK